MAPKCKFYEIHRMDRVNDYWGRALHRRLAYGAIPAARCSNVCFAAFAPLNSDAISEPSDICTWCKIQSSRADKTTGSNRMRASVQILDLQEYFTYRFAQREPRRVSLIYPFKQVWFACSDFARHFSMQLYRVTPANLHFSYETYLKSVLVKNLQQILHTIQNFSVVGQPFSFCCFW